MPTTRGSSQRGRKGDGSERIFQTGSRNEQKGETLTEKITHNNCSLDAPEDYGRLDAGWEQLRPEEVPIVVL
ncbi:MAG: hypothetical protein EOM90_06720 [Alphaproteobacteria bacterium]|nr:hypothetical protein [Alphaproteobacteria bacterium]